nr:hypothetical protein B0A51_02137 [Rachicladosporium sp. CCFEE 5018]
MLIISVLCLVAGITEYLAVRFASNLGTLRGSKANLAVLVTVVGASVLMIVFHELFEWLKWFVEWKRNYTTRKRLKELAQTLPSHNSAAANDPGPSATSEAQPDKIGGANIDLAIGDEVLPQVNSTSEDRLVATIKELEKYEARRQEEFDRQLLLALQRILERRDGL